ncbi:hypothetical protein A2U01_0049023, partial [Trifolium medium]|nr:hypothetical protein [Trifolium medium]
FEDEDDEWMMNGMDLVMKIMKD